ncbi:MAG: hypothetical protein S0880_13580 [Actinomycetota bacterium]|nr:hypothetical protein [Actinomycetota bacterium]
MTQITESIQIDVPAHAAYDRWSDLGSVPYLDDDVRYTRITTRQPDERLTWRSVAPHAHRGVVAFRPLSGAKTRVALRLDFDDDALDAGFDASAVEQRVSAALRAVKAELEARRSPAAAITVPA